MLTDLELGWLAGLLEGEGYFGYDKSNSTKVIELCMADEDIIYRAAVMISKVTGKQPNINFVPPKTESRVPTYRFKISGKSAVKIMKLLVKLMGSRRRKRIWQALNGYQGVKRLSREQEQAIHNVRSFLKIPKLEAVS